MPFFGTFSGAWESLTPPMNQPAGRSVDDRDALARPALQSSDNPEEVHSRTQRARVPLDFRRVPGPNCLRWTVSCPAPLRVI
jgi:hypothetical protein